MTENSPDFINVRRQQAESNDLIRVGKHQGFKF